MYTICGMNIFGGLFELHKTNIFYDVTLHERLNDEVLARSDNGMGCQLL